MNKIDHVIPIVKLVVYGLSYSQIIAYFFP